MIEGMIGAVGQGATGHTITGGHAGPSRTGAMGGASNVWTGGSGDPFGMDVNQLALLAFGGVALYLIARKKKWI